MTKNINLLQTYKTTLLKAEGIKDVELSSFGKESVRLKPR